MSNQPTTAGDTLTTLTLTVHERRIIGIALSMAALHAGADAKDAVLGLRDRILGIPPGTEAGDE